MQFNKSYVYFFSQNWPFNFNVNWDSNVKPNEDYNVKADWSDQKLYPNSSYDTSYDTQNSRKYTINRHPKRPKNALCQYEVESNHTIYPNPKCDQSDYKLYNYYG